MALVLKYRIGEVAKDFGVSNKEISAIMAEFFTAPKNHMQVLSNEELDVIFEVMTQRNQYTLEEIFSTANKEPAPGESVSSGNEESKEKPAKGKNEQKEKQPAAKGEKAPAQQTASSAPAAAKAGTKVAEQSILTNTMRNTRRWETTRQILPICAAEIKKKSRTRTNSAPTRKRPLQLNAGRKNAIR